MSWAKSSAGDITTYTDATGKKTTFPYTNGDLTSITAPDGRRDDVHVRLFPPSDQGRAAQHHRRLAGTAVTRFSTPPTRPRSSRTPAVGPVQGGRGHGAHDIHAHSNDLVEKAVDPEATSGPRRTSPRTTVRELHRRCRRRPRRHLTNSYDANDGQSLTQTQSASGSTDAATYGSDLVDGVPAVEDDRQLQERHHYGYDGPGKPGLHRNRRRRARRRRPRRSSTTRRAPTRTPWEPSKTAQAPATRSRPPTATTATTSCSRRSPHRPTQWPAVVRVRHYRRVNKHTDGGAASRRTRTTTTTGSSRPHSRTAPRR